MKFFRLIVTHLIIGLMLIYLFAVFGCAVSITQDSAQKAIDNAYSAIESAKVSNTDTVSQDNLKKAERLLSDAEDALRRNRRQRAYTLANKSIEMAKLAQSSAGQAPESLPSDQGNVVYSEIVTPPEKIKDSIPESAEDTSVKIMTKASKPSTTSKIIVQEPFQPEIPVKDSLQPREISSTRWEVSELDVQNRIKAAIQALDEAQKAVQSARLLMFKTQAEIGLSSADSTIQQVRKNGAPADVVSLIQLRYDQARKVMAEGSYEAAATLIQQAQTYAQAFLTPVE